MRANRLLILGGTREAADLARGVHGGLGHRVDVITSLAGRLPPSQKLPGRVRIGGFGGARALADYLRSERIGLVVDATHPFAATISTNAAAACTNAAVPHLILARPPWPRRTDDDWTEVADLPDAVSALALAPATRRVFLTTGPGGIGAFAGLAHVHFLVRLFAPPAAPPPLPDATVIVQRPPFTEDDERALMVSHGIDTLVTKQSGGPVGAKLAAARALGVRVVMVRRPPLPPGDVAETVDDAAAWIATHLSAL